MNMKKVTLHVSGTHCASCKILIEDVVNEQNGLSHAQVDLSKHIVSFETDSSEQAAVLAAQLSEKLAGNGYTFSVEKQTVQNKALDEVFWQALPIGLGVLAAFFVLQKTGVVDVSFGGEMSFTTAFVVGLVASVSSCLAVVGGLVLSLSAKVSQDNLSDTKTFALFHVGRLVSFALLGGVLGMLGSALGVNYTLTSILGILASVVMLFLGFNLIGVISMNKLTFGSSTFNFFRKVEHTTYAPLIVGFGTFFLPCGFTQAMQVAAVASGSFFSGSLIMLAFALGTLPMLALLSFGSASFAESRYAPVFFKASGVVVVGLALVTILAGLAGIGLIKPLFTI